jgi:hypothetical protein
MATLAIPAPDSPRMPRGRRGSVMHPNSPSMMRRGTASTPTRQSSLRDGARFSGRKKKKKKKKKLITPLAPNGERTRHDFYNIYLSIRYL